MVERLAQLEAIPKPSEQEIEQKRLELMLKSVCTERIRKERLKLAFIHTGKPVPGHITEEIRTLDRMLVFIYSRSGPAGLQKDVAEVFKGLRNALRQIQVTSSAP